MIRKVIFRIETTFQDCSSRQKTYSQGKLGANYVVITGLSTREQRYRFHGWFYSPSQKVPIRSQRFKGTNWIETFLLATVVMHTRRRAQWRLLTAAHVSEVLPVGWSWQLQ